MSSKLKVKHESLPARCEICHQTDSYDPIANYCSRCTSMTKQADQAPATRARKAPTLTQSEMGIASGVVSGLVIGLVFGIIKFGHLAPNTLNEVMLMIIPCCIAGAALFGIHGGFTGALVGKSFAETDGAEAIEAPGAVAGAVSNLRNNRMKKILRDLVAGALYGQLPLLPFLLFSWLVSHPWSSANPFITFWKLNFFIEHWQMISAWMLAAFFNGAPIGLICRNRSDRRDNINYPATN